MEPSVEQSGSVKWRLKGNELYKKGLAEGLCDSLAKDRLVRASAAYYKAVNLAVNNEEESSSAYKNLGIVYWKISQKTEKNTEKGRKEAFFYQKEAVKYLSGSRRFGADPRSLKNQDWLDKVDSLVVQVLRDADLQFREQLPLKSRIGRIYELFNQLELKSCCVDILIELIKNIFHEAVICREDTDFKTAIYWLNEVRRPLEDSLVILKQIETDSSLKADLEVKKEEVALELCIAESNQAISVGQELFTEHFYGSESLNMIAIYEALDWFKKAALISRDNSALEQEASASHFIGFIYEKIFKLNGKAKEYYMRVMHLVDACGNAQYFQSKIWYKDTMKSLQEFQAQALRRDEQEKQKAKQKYLDDLKEDIDKIKEANKNEYEFIKYLYTNHPPKADEDSWKFKIPSDMERMKELMDIDMTSETKKEKKKLLIRAVHDYHPDKNLSQEDDEESKKWKVFAEFITQSINFYYESLKG